jgi:N6-L-threonylcarbamoyladenine synthase
VLCLGIESSCDESALALVRDGVLVDSVMASQADLHSLFGGVVPELASREHYRFLGPLWDRLATRSGLTAADLDVVAVARGPGLLGSLLVGVAFAKGLALASGAGFVGINHLHAHLLAVGLLEAVPFPALGLLVSGGHTDIYLMEDPMRFTRLGRGLDDAAGEALDKIAKLLSLPYPGGAHLDALARRGRADPKLFPRPYLDNDNLDFSFSGLKTAVAAHLARRPDSFRSAARQDGDAPGELCDLCASVNLAVAETLCAKAERALNAFPHVGTLILAGGVAANTLLRERAARMTAERGARLLVPPPELCTDNGAMIAYAGFLAAQRGFGHSLDMESVPRGKALPDDAIPMRKTRIPLTRHME